MAHILIPTQSDTEAGDRFHCVLSCARPASTQAHKHTGTHVHRHTRSIYNKKEHTFNAFNPSPREFKASLVHQGTLGTGAGSYKKSYLKYNNTKQTNKQKQLLSGQVW